MSVAGTAAMDYHEKTKHSETSVRMSTHHLDWKNRPYPFKVYRNLPPSIPLPREFPTPITASLDAISGPVRSGTSAARPFDLATTAELLFFSLGLTRRMKLNQGTYLYMRAAAATGALYPIEAYVIAGQIPGLSAGVYHFDPLEFALIRLREGDYRGELAEAISSERAKSCPIVVVLTSLAWRNAWKYEERSYRHWFWDSGVIAANLLATSTAENLQTELVMGFVDSEVDRLLGLERGREATVALALVGVGRDDSAPRGRRGEVSQLNLQVEPLSAYETRYPLIWQMNEASALSTRQEVQEWRSHLPSEAVKDEETRDVRKVVPPQHPTRCSSPSLADVILKRGSTRRFAKRPISLEQLSTILDVSSGNIPLDFLTKDDALIETYLIANDVSGLASGTYHFDWKARSLEQLKAGSFRRMSEYLCLEQPLFGGASVVFFLMTDLLRTVNALGDRGYRAAQFEAGVRAGKIYLSSYSLALGASGSTFYDDAVTEFFSPHAADKSAMIAVGVGVPAYRARAGTILAQRT